MVIESQIRFMPRKVHGWPGTNLPDALRTIGKKNIVLRLGGTVLEANGNKTNFEEALLRHNSNNTPLLNPEKTIAMLRTMGTDLGTGEFKFYGIKDLDLNSFIMWRNNIFLAKNRIVHNMKYGNAYQNFYDRYMNDLIGNAKTPEQKGFALMALSYALMKHDFKTWMHVNEVRLIISKVLNALHMEDEIIPGTSIHTAELGGNMHDLGKLGLVFWLLHKMARNEEERKWVLEQIREPHVMFGVNLDRDIPWLPQEIQDMTLFHHANWGYPAEIKGRMPSKEARVLNVVDSLHAMMTRAHMDMETAFNKLLDERSGYDLQVVYALKETVQRSSIEELFPGSVVFHRYHSK